MKEFNSSISIIGSGNVANHLGKGFVKEGVQVSHIYSRNTKTARELASEINSELVGAMSDLPNQLCIVCVSDDSVLEVINSIPKEIPIAYTSGSIKLSSIKNRDKVGVFYPLQTFTKERNVDLFEVPIFIESNSDYLTSTLFDLAWEISRTVKHSSSDERAKMHLAAVFVNNFTNHIVHLAQKYSSTHEIDFDNLKPLLKETIRKLDTATAFDSQTGPAKRKDQGVIQYQSNKLTGDMKKVYEVITDSIINTHNYDEL